MRYFAAFVVLFRPDFCAKAGGAADVYMRHPITQYILHK
jgi:hypothetical protein